MRHGNLSIFVPNAGCPHRCSFCSQREISGTAAPPTAEEVTHILAGAPAAPGICREIAFFGGSFTAIPRAYMRSLLEAAAPFMKSGVFSGIRISTRPDAVGEDILRELRDYGVTAIELGAQSMSDTVLSANLRGHTAKDVREASARIRDAGFELGLQMMTGLYRSDERADLDTAAALSELFPQTVRIYPALVLKHTDLAELWRAGEYRPQPLSQAVSLCGTLLEFFEEKNIRVIRVGLHAEKSLEENLLAGPYHPAFRELCEQKRLQKRLETAFEGKKPGNYTVELHSPSQLTGHGGSVLAYLRDLGYNVRVRTNSSMARDAIQIERLDEIGLCAGKCRQN